MTEIRTERLLLRQPRLSDAPALIALVDDWDVARMTGTIPHPYTAADAEAFLTGNSDALVFAITRDDQFLGCCGATPRRGIIEIGYWLGRPFWGKGYATEAAAALIDHVQRTQPGETLEISHFVDNPASARVIAKLKCQPVGERLSPCRARGLDVRAVIYALPKSPEKA
jgi:[ribosomal protein S5]-alanine N-acetyltransferase